MFSHGRVIGLFIQVSSQEHKHHYSEVLQQMEKFINETASKIVEELSDEDFEDLKDARIKMLTTEDLEVESEAHRNWKEIKTLRYMFDRQAIAAKITKSLTKSDVQEIFRSTIHIEKMRKLSVQVIGNNPNGEKSIEDGKDREYDVKFISEKLSDDENIVLNLDEFQSKLMLYPFFDANFLIQ